MKKVLAFDLGASSGRGIIATIDNEKITLNEIHRFSNNGIKVRNTLYWDILYLFDQIKQGINKANLCGGFDSIAIDTWGVDFGLLDENGDLLSNPVNYRDLRTQNIPEEIFKEIPKKELYEETGIQILNFNTLFQMYYLAKYRPKTLAQAKKFLMIPDLLNYFLTGIMKNEYTDVSTTQMLNPYTKKWNTDLLDRLNIPTDLFCDMIEPGNAVGNLSEEICEELGINKTVPVIAVGSHDTASAVVAVPQEKGDFVYISCGTWSLFGTELSEPIINEKGMKFSYTNEGGFGNTIRYLTNIMGLWLIQESRRTWNKQGNDLSFNDLEKAALACEPFKCFIDPDYYEFQTPGNIPKRIQEFCMRTNQYVPQTIGEITRCIYESLALKYKYSYINLQEITGKKIDGGIHIVGGGTKDPLLCQMTSSACNTTVSAGPIEATALGNIAVQFIAMGEIENISEARKIIKNSFDIKEYSPINPKEWDTAYEKFAKLMEEK